MTKEFLRKLYYWNIYSNLRSKGSNIRLSTNGTIVRPEELSIGSNVFVGKGFTISARNMKIGDNVMIGPYFLAECDDHIFNKVGKSMHETRNIRNESSITIENDVWIGGHVTILKGVSIKEGSIIGAGSVVTKSVAPYSISFGNPCKFHKPRFSRGELKQHLGQIKTTYSYEAVIEQWRKISDF